MNNYDKQFATYEQTDHVLWKPFDNLYWLAMGLEEACVASNLFGSKTEWVMELCCERWIPEKFNLAEIDKPLDVFRRLRQVLEDDLDGNFPTDYGEYYNSGLDAIKHGYLCGIEREIQILEDLISQLESPGHTQ